MDHPVGDPAKDNNMDDALDAYSAVVTRVAAELTPHVASLQIGPSGGSRGGSAVVYTGDGYLLTNAHVVRDHPSGTALFSDGTQAQVDVVGTDPLSDLAVVRSRPTRRSGRQPARDGRVGHRRRRQRSGSVPAGTKW